MAVDNQIDPLQNDGENQKLSENGTDNLVKARFDLFCKELEANEMQEVDTAFDVAEDNLKQAESSVENNKTRWKKAKENLIEYLLIKHSISLKLVQGVTELQEDIQTSKEKFTDMDQLFSAACTSIKDVSKKILLVNGAICQLENAMKDSCNQKEVETYKDLKSKVKKMSEMCNTVSDKASANVGTSVKVAGVKALLNLDSLVAMGNQIKTETDNFKTNVEMNIASSISGEATSKEDYNTSIVGFCKAKADREIASLEREGLFKLKDFSAPDHERKAPGIDEILESAEKNFESQHH